MRDLSWDLTVRLEHADEDKDLELADHRDVVPLLLRRHVLDEATVREGGGPCVCVCVCVWSIKTEPINVYKKSM